MFSVTSSNENFLVSDTKYSETALASSNELAINIAEMLNKKYYKIFTRDNKVYSLNDILDEIILALKEKFNSSLKNVILYGSYARGDYRHYSDVDLLIIVDIPHAEAMEIITDITAKYIDSHELIINALNRTSEEFKHSNAGLFSEVEKEGIVLYGN